MEPTTSEPVVEQGPEFVVELLSNPPAWLLAVMAAVAISTVVLSALSFRRNGIETEMLREMGEIATIVFSITVCATIWVDVSSWGYLVDVLGSTLVGFLFAQVVIRLAKEHATFDADLS